ncbi:probable ADK2-adenylate kinase, mitochondrial [Serendipita indica DSM 11827]|uniref:GTP:AMP phosphotransferase, mitochondrial n=1 Tax=Serendipita indica (strain DSM 11827) TaxID=1109443 RepID=G4TM32_SERID|nr:probable ADK2-adenylate kinase, mitochondrial [Serendipita indica DSM 11827]
MSMATVCKQAVKPQAMRRAFSTTSANSFTLPPRYGAGPLYRTKLSPKDAITHNEQPVLRMLMFGKPGSGKGTLSNKLINKYDVSQLSAGDLLRSNIAEGTEVGRVAEGIIATGGLVPDDIMTKVITSKLDALKNKHWILDGFPRTVGQGQLLEAHLRTSGTPLTLIINLDVPEEVILGRISDRWVHLQSGRVYNSSYNKPKVAGFDDITGEPLVKRPDDNPEIFARRLKAFNASTLPLLQFFSSTEGRASTKLVTLTGATSDEIWPKLEQIITSEFRLRPRGAQKTSVQEAFFGSKAYGQGPLYTNAAKL